MGGLHRFSGYEQHLAQISLNAALFVLRKCWNVTKAVFLVIKQARWQ